MNHGSRAAAISAIVASLTVIACSGTAGGALAPPTTMLTVPTSTTSTTTSTSTTLPPNGAYTSNHDALVQLARRSVVRVRRSGCEDLGTGSAWLSTDGSLISNRHVVMGFRLLEITTWDGKDLEPTSVTAGYEADIGRLHGSWSEAPELQPLEIAPDRVADGQRVAVLGYARGGEVEAAVGTVLGYVSDPALAPREILKLEAAIAPGDSGGPVVDDDGRVVGVVFAREIATSAALVIPIWDVVGPTAAPLVPIGPCKLASD